MSQSKEQRDYFKKKDAERRADHLNGTYHNGQQSWTTTMTWSRDGASTKRCNLCDRFQTVLILLPDEWEELEQ